jgi:hypothetical protein
VGDTVKKIVILGQARSGTTLLAGSLMTHPDTSGLKAIEPICYFSANVQYYKDVLERLGMDMAQPVLDWTKWQTINLTDYLSVVFEEQDVIKILHNSLHFPEVLNFIQQRNDICLINQKRKNLLAQCVSNIAVNKLLFDLDGKHTQKIKIDSEETYQYICDRVADERFVDIHFPHARTIWYEDLIADWNLYTQHIQEIAEWRVVQLAKFQPEREDSRLTQDRVINPEIIEELQNRPFSNFIYWE